MSSNRGMTGCKCCEIQILNTNMSQLCARCFWALTKVNASDIKCSYHGNVVITQRDDNVITR